MLSRHLRIVALTTFLAVVVNTQTIVPTSSNPNFPGCALSCSVLLAAQITCTPPYVAQTNQLAYDNCFCQFSTLQPLYSTPDAVCAAECTIEDDRQILQRWFTTFCRQVGQGIDPVASTATTNTPQTTTVAGGGTNGEATATLGTSPASSSDATPHGSNWFATHWKWVVMVIVLFCGLILVALLAICCKRRYKRKRQEKVARMSGFPLSQEKGGVQAAMITPDLWGPHQHMAMTQGYQYPRDNAPIGPRLFRDTPTGPNNVDEITVVEAARTRSKRGHTRRHSSSKQQQKDIVRVKEQELTAETLPTRSRSSRPRPSELDVGLRAAEAERSKSRRRSAHSETRQKGQSAERRLQGLPEDAIRPDGESRQ